MLIQPVQSIPKYIIDPNVMVRAYHANYLLCVKLSVIPLLDYCFQVWNLAVKKEIRKMEEYSNLSLRHFSIEINHLHMPCYHERMKVFALEILLSRTVQNDLVLLFRVFRREINLGASKFQIFRLSSHRNGGILTLRWN